MLENEDQIAKAFRDYFMVLFKTSSHTISDIVHCTKDVMHKVIEEMNSRLVKAYTREKVIEALKQIGHLKSPSLDGLEASFYQSN